MHKQLWKKIKPIFCAVQAKIGFLAFIALVITHLLITTLANSFPMNDAAVMGYYYIIGWILPGIAIISLFNLNQISFLEFFGLGCLFGYCYNIAIYYILFPMGIGHLTGITILIFGIISMAVIILKWKYIKSLPFDSKGFAICTVFLFLILLIRFFAFDMDTLLPISIPMNIYYQDILFWILHKLREYGYLA